MSNLNIIYRKAAKKGVVNPRVESEAEDILFVGINNPQTFLGMTESMDKSEYQITNINNSFKAYTWLENYTNRNYKQPCAIICDLNFLEEDDYLLLSNIQNNKQLSLIPFLLVSDKPASMDSMSALKRGIDDFYAAPFNWEDLKNRIQFLNMFKAERSKLNLTEDKGYEEQTPTSKRAFDILFAVTALIALSPVLLLIAMLIKLESKGKGKVFYSSKRIGSGYKVFDFYKFRSMREGADKELQKLSHLNQYGESGDANENTFVKLKNDPRVTRIGRLIRKTSLDELPQLLNVLFGDMSIVGNRPLPVYEAEQLTKDEWSQRFLAPAGITGLWQVTKRGKDNMSVTERMELDIEYAKRFSLWYDLKIIFKTIPAMFQHEAV
ncbi:MAG: sugar transferase [Chitinophagales bacterium]